MLKTAPSLLLLVAALLGVPLWAATTPAARATADQDFAAFEALLKEPPPQPPRESGFVKYLTWLDAHLWQITKSGLAFYAQHPADKRRWEVVLALTNQPPTFARHFGPEVETKGFAAVVPDAAAKTAWEDQARELWQALLRAEDSSLEQKESADFASFALRSRRLRDRLVPGDVAAARVAWQTLVAAFDAHIQRFSGSPRLTEEAKSFIGAWASLIPGSEETMWRHFSDLRHPVLSVYAAQRLESLRQPLALAFQATDGREVDVADLRGKVVLIDFWATWCGPCKAEIPNVKSVYEKYHALGFEVIGIALENAQLKPADTPEQTTAKLEKARQALVDFTTANDMPWPQYFDGKFWSSEFIKRYAITALPAMFLLDQEGRVVSTDARGTRLEQEVRRLLKL